MSGIYDYELEISVINNKSFDVKLITKYPRFYNYLTDYEHIVLNKNFYGYRAVSTFKHRKNGYIQFTSQEKYSKSSGIILYKRTDAEISSIYHSEFESKSAGLAEEFSQVI